MALTEMTATIDSEQDSLEFDSVPEFLRDAQLPNRDNAVRIASRMFNQKTMEEQMSNLPPIESEAPKSDELEALWPGVHTDHHDFTPKAKRGPSFYLSVGFAGGAVISLIGVFAAFSVNNWVVANNKVDNKTVIAAAPAGTAQPAAQSTVAVGDALIPASPQYEVQAGDTLAGIAYKNYKRVSPRLLDEIVKANGMRSANVLNLGQKLNLPEYHPAGQIAAAPTGAVQQ